jgi:hypothetical protein
MVKWEKDTELLKERKTSFSSNIEKLNQNMITSSIFLSTREKILIRQLIKQECRKEE